MAEYQSFVTSSGNGDDNEFRFGSPSASMPAQHQQRGGGGGIGGGGGLGLRDRWSSWTGGMGGRQHEQDADAKARQLAQVGNLDIIREVPKRISNLNWGERLWGPSLDLNQLIMREDWALAAMQCKMRPHLAGRWLERSGFFMGRHSASVLPLHQAVALRPPVEMIQTLVITHPAGIKAKETSFGRIPLHVACRSGASAEAVECLLAYHPDGAMEGDTLKRIPLHYALKNDAEEGVVDLLLEAYPDGVNRADHRGWIPLHVACSVGTDLRIIHKIVEENPETLLVKTHKGSDPVKCAQMSKGHPNEAAIVEFVEKEVAKLKDGGRGDDDDDGDGDDGGEDGKSQGDESHHEDDEDLIDLGGGGGVGGEEEKENAGEADLIGLGSGPAAANEGNNNNSGGGGAVHGDENKEATLLDLGGGDGAVSGEPALSSSAAEPELFPASKVAEPVDETPRAAAADYSSGGNLLDLGGDGLNNGAPQPQDAGTASKTNPPAEANAGQEAPPTAISGGGNLLDLGDYKEGANNIQNGKGRNDAGGDGVSPSNAAGGLPGDGKDDDGEDEDDDGSNGERDGGGQNLIDLDGADVTNRPEENGGGQNLIDLGGGADASGGGGGKGGGQDFIDFGGAVVPTENEGQETLIDLGE